MPGKSPLRQGHFTADLSDADLVERSVAGDTWAQEALFRRYVKPVTRLVTHTLRSTRDTDDVVQDAFAEIFQRLGNVRDPSAFLSWLYKITVNRCRKVLRRRRLARMVGLDWTVEDERLEECAKSDASQYAVADLRSIDRSLDRLSADQRIAWVLRRVHGESPEAIAEFLDCSLATAKRRISEAHAAIVAFAEGGEP